MVILKRVLFFLFAFGLSLATLGAHLATPGSWFDWWYLDKYMTYGIPVNGTHWGPVSYIFWICLVVALVLTWLILAGPAVLRRMFAAGPRIGPLGGFTVPLAVPRGRRRRVRP